MKIIAPNGSAAAVVINLAGLTSVLPVVTSDEAAADDARASDPA